MTAPLLACSAETAPSSALRYKATGGKEPSHARAHRKLAARTRNRLPAPPVSELVDLSGLLGRVLEVLPQGVMIVSRNFKPVYWNQKAKAQYSRLGGHDYAETVLPLPVSEVCHRLVRAGGDPTTTVMLEFCTKDGTLMRLRATWLEQVLASDRGLAVVDNGSEAGGTAFIAVFLENCTEMMQTEMHLQQQKYDLTEREAEIWMLLRQELTYQEIAQQLQISLNTVKTHVKNVYAKRRSCQGQERSWGLCL
mgnify:CR=1 FL=1